MACRWAHHLLRHAPCQHAFWQERTSQINYEQTPFPISFCRGDWGQPGSAGIETGASKLDC